MSRTHKDSARDRAKGGRPGRRRNISVRAVRRDPPDYRKLSRAVVDLALAQAEAEAAAAQSTSPTDEPDKTQEPHED